MPYNSLEYFHHACQSIIDNKDAKAVNWAVNYARHGLTITDIYEAKHQSLYILSNITHWRGPIASETRSILKNIGKDTTVRFIPKGGE